jgi:DnaJ-class molecular chaperone
MRALTQRADRGQIKGNDREIGPDIRRGVKVQNGTFRMKKPIANPTEQRCPACDGTGFPTAGQPVLAGRRIYPPPCKECGGKGANTRGGRLKR